MCVCACGVWMSVRYVHVVCGYVVWNELWMRMWLSVLRGVYVWMSFICDVCMDVFVSGMCSGGYVRINVYLFMYVIIIMNSFYIALFSALTNLIRFTNRFPHNKISTTERGWDE